MNANSTETRKLIEVALPLDKINPNFESEKRTPGGPKSIHQWWARRPFTSARAVIWASIVDDPSSRPKQFPTQEAIERERERLFGILEDLSDWKKSSDKVLIEEARRELRKYLGNDSSSEIQFLDPFSGGGAIPLEAQRLGLKVAAFDLNPVSVIINKSMIEIPPRFVGVNSVSQNNKKLVGSSSGMYGMAQDLEYYGNLLEQLAYEKVKDKYPTTVNLPQELGGRTAEVFAWIWVRTVKCPNPRCHCEVPLYRNCILDDKKGREAYIQPYYEDGNLCFDIIHKKFPSDGQKYTIDRHGARCSNCGTPIDLEYVREEGRKHRLISRLAGIVVYNGNKRLYLSPSLEEEQKANVPLPEDFPEGTMADNPANLQKGTYGFNNFEELFSNRQMQGLVALCETLKDIRNRIEKDAISIGMANNKLPLRDGGKGALAYAEALSVYLAFAIDKTAAVSNTMSQWEVGSSPQALYNNQSINMKYMWPEANIFGNKAGSFKQTNTSIADCLNSFPSNVLEGTAKQHNAQEKFDLKNIIISTDPPYYDNIQYADISDFYYIWLKFNLREIYPALFRTVLTPKQEEIVAQRWRYGGEEAAKEHFELGMQNAMKNIYSSARTDIPVTIFYAYKESGASDSSGWETMLNAIIKAGFSITATWPLRTEAAKPTNSKANTLTTSVVIVCRKRKGSSFCQKRQFLSELKQELKPALERLQKANLAPVDLAQASIGPGIAIFSRYDSVLSADGREVTVGEALQLINQEVDICLHEFGESLDNESRFCLTLFQQYGFKDMKSGEADILAQAKDTSISKLKNEGLVDAGEGLVQLVTRERLPEIKGNEDNIWFLCQRLVYKLQKDGIKGCAKELRKIKDSNRTKVKNLAYYLYTISDKKNWNSEAYEYNSLVVAWQDLKSELSRPALPL